MGRTLSLLAGALSAAALSLPADARGQGGGFGALGGGLDRAFGGISQAVPHPGGSAYKNSNGRFSQDRDKGLERAEERMSPQGLDHEKATEARKQRGGRGDARNGPRR